MPYIEDKDKERAKHHPTTVGELTYAITRLCVKFTAGARPLRFITIALVMGALFCAALEFYRRIAVPYENAKLAENGDVYD